jgi:transcription elongation factor Elf1
MQRTKRKSKTSKQELVKQKSKVFFCPHCRRALDVIHVIEYKPSYAEGLKVICRFCKFFEPKWITPKSKFPDDD